MDKKKTIRIWLYPFNDTNKNGYKIHDIGEGGIKAVLTKNHLDVFVDDKEEHDDDPLNSVKTLLDNAAKPENKSNWQFVIFQHTSTKPPNIETILKSLIRSHSLHSLYKDIIPLSNGSEKNSSNYAALHQAIQYFHCKGKSSNGRDIVKADRRIVDNICTFIFTGDKQNNTYAELTESEPEVQDDWKNFFEAIKGTESDLFKTDHKVWTFVKNGLHYKLLDLTFETLLFKELIRINTKEDDLKNAYDAFIQKQGEYEKQEEQHAKNERILNIILAPGDLTKHDYSEQLFREILYRGVINIKDSDSTIPSNDNPNIPLLLICNKADNGQNFYNASIWTRMINLYELENKAEKEYKRDVEDYKSREEKEKRDWVHKFINQKIQKLVIKYIEYIEKQTIAYKQLYKLDVAQEFFDLQTRLYKNSYLSGSHNNISPILFHDEESFEELYLEKRKKILELIRNIDNPTLNILVIDDFANKKLKPKQKKHSDPKDTETEDETLTKIQILNNLEKSSELEKLTFEIFPKEDGDIQNFSADGIIDYINKTLTDGKKPDIILLDYNLGDKDKGSKIFIELIKRIEEDNKADTRKLKHRGPFDKLWIFPITAFSNAFIDEIRAAGLGFIDEKYKLSRGADFINTPNLFKYYFSKMVLEIISMKANILTHNFQEVLDKIAEAYKTKEDLRPYASEKFNKHLQNKRNIDLLFQAETGILNSIKGDKAEIEKTQQQINFYEQLLYNLTYRNHENNEEIIIFYDLLKKSLGRR